MITKLYEIKSFGKKFRTLVCKVLIFPLDSADLVVYTVLTIIYDGTIFFDQNTDLVVGSQVAESWGGARMTHQTPLT